MVKPRTIYETGGSIVVSLPRGLLAEVGLDIGDAVLVDAQNGRLVVSEAEISEAHRPGGGDS